MSTSLQEVTTAAHTVGNLAESNPYWEEYKEAVDTLRDIFANHVAETVQPSEDHENYESNLLAEIQEIAWVDPSSLW